MRLDKIFVVMGLLVSASMCSGMSSLIKGLQKNKAPLKIIGLYGEMPQEWAVIGTTITIRGKRKPGTLGPTPIIKRENLKTLTLGKSSAPFDFDLKTPSVQVDVAAAAYNIPDMAAKIAGACDPRAGAVAGAIAAVSQLACRLLVKRLIECLNLMKLLFHL